MCRINAYVLNFASQVVLPTDYPLNATTGILTVVEVLDLSSRVQYVNM